MPIVETEKEVPLESISSSSFLALMNSSADCSSLDRRDSNLVEEKECGVTKVSDPDSVKSLRKDRL